MMRVLHNLSVARRWFPQRPGTGALLLLPLLARGEIFTDDNWGDIHGGFPAAKAVWSSNAVPFVFAHTNYVADTFGRVAGPIRIVTWHGDCAEDDRPLTNGLGTATYSGQEVTNDARALAQSGLMFFVNDGNHDSDNTNGTYGNSFYTHGTVVNPWNVMFPPSLWTNQSYYHSNKDAGAYNNMVMKFERAGVKLLYVSYHTDASTNSLNDQVYTNQTEWIRGVMRANRDYNVIVCGHFFLGQAGGYTNIAPSYTDHAVTYSNYSIGPGRAPVDGGLLAEPNLAGFKSGHNVPLWKGHYMTNGTDGHPIFFMQFNTQASSQNADFHSTLTFDSMAGTVSGRTFCSSEDRWLADYETTTTFTNAFFPGGFRNNFTMTLPVPPPRVFPIYKRP